MLILIILCSIAAIAAGLAVKFFFDRFANGVNEVTPVELVIGSVLCAVIVIPLVTWAGFSIVRGNTVSYNEYLSGLEKKAWEKTTVCHRDGSCRHTYSCDPYTVYHPAQYDSKGKQTLAAYTETRYHECPYTDTEHSFYVSDTLGQTYTMGDHWFPDTPSQHRYRDKNFPSGISKGTPALWQQAKDRIAAGEPGGTTKRSKYDNFIQASQDDILDKASDAIAGYKKAGVLPKVTTRVYDHYRADKVYFPTGVPVGTSRKDWEDSLARLNGKIGGEKHGDLHLVLVNASKISDADRYTNALQAYWQSPELGKDTLSKNGIVVIVGFSNTGVSWARGFTGMPVGNEALSVAVREKLTEQIVTPGHLVPAIQSLLFASGDAGFKRVEMTDYRYLFDSIQPSGWAKFWIAFVAFVLSLMIWAGLALVDVNVPNPFHKE